MRPAEIREMTDEEIGATLEELSNELFELRLRSAYEEIENPMRIRQVRREIARIKTIKRERELAAARDAED